MKRANVAAVTVATAMSFVFTVAGCGGGGGEEGRRPAATLVGTWQCIRENGVAVPPDERCVMVLRSDGKFTWRCPNEVVSGEEIIQYKWYEVGEWWTQDHTLVLHATRIYDYYGTDSVDRYYRGAYRLENGRLTLREEGGKETKEFVRQ